MEAVAIQLEKLYLAAAEFGGVGHPASITDSMLR